MYCVFMNSYLNVSVRGKQMPATGIVCSVFGEGKMAIGLGGLPAFLFFSPSHGSF